MNKLLNMVGMTVGGWIGWAIGAPFSFSAAFVMSTVGTGLGLWAGIRFGRYLLS